MSDERPSPSPPQIPPGVLPEPETVDSLLAQDARVRRVSRMVPATGPLTPSLRSDIVDALKRRMDAGEYSQSDVATAIGSSPTYINNLVTGKGNLPEETRDQLLRDINNWLEREQRARDNPKPANFVQTTKVATRIFALAERLTERADIAVAFGPAGIGKTISSEAVAAELNATYLRISHHCRTRSGLIRALGAIFARRQQRRAQDLNFIIERLRQPERVTTRSLVILDNAHELDRKAFKVLMDIFDLAKCSILLVGTIDLKRAVATDDDPEFGQMASRVGMRIDLADELGLDPSRPPSGRKIKNDLFTVADIRAIFQQGKLKIHTDAARMLMHMANTRRGMLRRVERLMYWATKAARKQHADEVSMLHLRAAAKIVGEDLDTPDTDLPPAEGETTRRAEATA